MKVFAYFFPVECFKLLWAMNSLFSWGKPAGLKQPVNTSSYHPQPAGCSPASQSNRMEENYIKKVLCVILFFFRRRFNLSCSFIMSTIFLNKYYVSDTLAWLCLTLSSEFSYHKCMTRLTFRALSKNIILFPFSFTHRIKFILNQIWLILIKL